MTDINENNMCSGIHRIVEIMGESYLANQNRLVSYF